MSRMPISTRSASVPAALLALACIALLAGGCSSKSTSAAAPVTGPTFDFAFTTVGESHEVQFTTAGTYNYHCAVHSLSGMTGVVIVDPGAASDTVAGGVDVGPGSLLAFVPASVTIKPNGRVRWVNKSSAFATHTVTRP